MVFLSRRIAAACVLSVVALLSACGGGGGGEDAVSLSYSTSLIRATAFNSQMQGSNAFEEASTTVTVTVTNPPDAPAYVFVGDLGSGFSGRPMEVVQTSDTTFQVTLYPMTLLDAGVHTGELSVLLCKDAQCTSRYTVENDRVPYEVTITPQLKADVVVDGTPVYTLTSDSGSNQIGVETEANDVVVEFTSTIPVSLHYSSGLPGMPVVEVDPSSTDTYLKVRVSRASADAAGSLQLQLWPEDDSKGIQWGVNYDVTFTSPAI